MKRVPPEVASYYAKVAGDHKVILMEMRERILNIAPGAEEIIKYGMPTFVEDGVPIAGLMSHKNHIGYYPYSGSIIDQFPEIAAKYKTSKGAIQVPLSRPMLKGEIRKLIIAKRALSRE